MHKSMQTKMIAQNWLMYLDKFGFLVFDNRCEIVVIKNLLHKNANSNYVKRNNFILWKNEV